MKRILLLPVLATLGVASLLAAPAHAQNIIDNLFDAPAGTDTNGDTAAAQQFITGSTAGNLSNVFVNVIGTPADTLSVFLYSDASNSPGSELDSLGTAVPPSDSSFNVVSLTPLTPFTLAPDTAYWIVGLYTGTQDWAFTNSTLTSGSGTIGDGANSTTGPNNWSVFPPSFGPYQIGVATSSVAAPEPSDLALLIPAFVCTLAVVGRRRRN